MSTNFPLIRSGSNDKLYRVNTGSDRLMRMLKPSTNTSNFGCFMPSDIPLWTDGQAYNVGDIVYGIYNDTTRICGIFQCRIDHIADVSNKPNCQYSYIGKAYTTLHWTALGHTSSLLLYPPCGTLAYSGAEPYGGVNKTPTGMLLKFNGIQLQEDSVYNTDNAKLPFAPNGVYCVPAGIYGADHSFYFGGLMDAISDPYDLVCWTMSMYPSRRMWYCNDGDLSFHLTCRKETLNDNWWQTNHVFCSTLENASPCQTNILLNNTLIEKPVPMPEYQSPEWNDLRTETLPAKECIDSNSYYPVFGAGWGGTVEFLGFTDYLYVGYDDYSVEYDGNAAANVRTRFALFRGTEKIMVLKNNILCNKFELAFNGNDWQVFLGATMSPLTGDADGWFEYSVIREGSDIIDFGITNVQCYNWKYRFAGHSDINAGTDIHGTLYGA